MAGIKSDKTKPPIAGKLSRQPVPVPTTKTANLLIEPLEPRVLFSADVLGVPLTDDLGDQTSSFDASNQPLDGHIVEHTPVELIFLDSTLPQSSLILEDLHNQKSAGRNIEIIVLQADGNGIEVISNALTGKTNVSAIHIISHGTDEGVQLGSSWINSDAVTQNKILLNQWQESLTESADILIYGCNLAASAEGIALIDALAKETNADIAASKDSTGHNNLSANWSLEHQSGEIESEIALSVEAQLLWENELNTGLFAVDYDLGTQLYNSALQPASFSLGDAESGASHDITINSQINPPSSVDLAGVLDPANGDVVRNTDNTYTYTPAVDYTGSETIPFVISDNADGVQHYWPLDDNADGIAVDEVAGLNGAIYGDTMDIVQGPLNHFDFNDSGSITIPAINYKESFTLSFEFKLGSDLSGVEQFIDQGQWVGTGGAIFGVSTEPGTIEVFAGGTAFWGDNLITVLKTTDGTDHTNLEVPLDTLADEMWHNYTLTLAPDNNGLYKSSLYIDGVFQPGTDKAIGYEGFYNSKGMAVAGSADDINATKEFLDDHRMRELRIYDGVVAHSEADVLVELEEQNLAPDLQLNITTNQRTFENADPIILAESAVVSDLNIDSSESHDGATLSISRSTGANPNDSFGLNGGDLQEGSSLDINGTSIGTVETNLNGHLKITFNSNSSTALVNEAIQQITYQNTSSTPAASVTLDWVFDDGITGAPAPALSDTDSVTVEIIPVPNITINAPGDYQLDEDSTYTPATISIDHDVASSDPVTARINSSNGTLSATANGATVAGNGTPQLVMVGTQTQINDSLATLNYQPHANYHGDDVITINVDTHLATQLDSTVGIQRDAARQDLQTPSNPTPLFEADPVRGEVLTIENGEHIEINSRFGDPQDVTVSAWVNLDKAGEHGAEVISIGDMVSLRVDYHYANGNPIGLTGSFYHEQSTDWQQLSHLVTLENSGWHHIAYAITNGYQRLYLDGTEVARSSITTDQTSVPQELIYYNGPGNSAITTIGTHSNYNNSYYYFDGQISDAKVHSRVLSPNEIATIASAQPATSATHEILIDVVAVNDKPQINNVGSTHNIAETVAPNPATPIVLENSIAIEDIEAKLTGGFDNTSISIQRTDADTTAPGPINTANANDIFGTSSPQTYDLTEGAEIIDGIAIGKVVQNSDGILTITFYPDATSTKVDALLKTITYENHSSWPATRVELTWSFNDAGNDNNAVADATKEEIATGITTIYIAAVNQPLTVTTNETYTVAFADTSQIVKGVLETTDSDNSPSEIQYTVTLAPSEGYLSLDGVRLDDPANNNSFTQQNINDGKLTYTSTSTSNDATAYDKFDFQVQDGQGSQESGTFNIETLRDIPSNLSSGIRLNKDGGNDAYLYDTSGYEYINGKRGVTWEFIFSELEPNPGGETTLYSAAASPSHHEHLVIQPDGVVEWDIATLIPYVGTPAVATSNAHPELFDGQRHTVSMTLAFENDDDGGGIKLFIDGVLAGSTPIDLEGGSAGGEFPWIIGQQLSPGSDFNNLSFEPKSHFSGTLHDVRMWDHVRSDDDILNSRNARFDGDPNQREGGDSSKHLMVNWQMEELIDINGDGTVLQVVDATAKPDNSTDPVTMVVAHVLDSNPPPSDGFIRSNPVDELAVGDDAVNGTTVGFVMPRDPLPDYPNGYTYTFDDPGYDGPFTINPTTGEVTVTDASQLNPLSPDAYQLVIKVTGEDSFGVEYDEIVGLTIHSINEPPTLTPGQSAITPVAYNENAEPVVMDPAMTIADEELDTFNNYEGALLKIARKDGNTSTIPNTDDQFSGSDLLTIPASGFFEYDGVVIGSVLTNSAGTLELQFNAQTTNAIANKVLQSISYSNSSDDPTVSGTVTDTVYFLWQFSDGNTNTGGPADQGAGESLRTFATTSINLIPINDPPTVNLVNNPIKTIPEDTEVEISFSELLSTSNAADIDGSVTGFIVTNTSAGTLRLGSDTYSATPYSANNNQVTNSIKAYWTPDANSNGILEAFSIIALDDLGAISDKAGTQGTNVQFEILAVNDAPEGKNSKLVIAEDTKYIFSNNDFGYTDPDFHNFQSVKIKAIPSTGSLLLSGTPIAAGDVINASSISALEYNPVPNTNGMNYDSIAFQVIDDGGTANGGVDTDPTWNYLKIDVKPANKEPMGADNTITTLEDTAYTFDSTVFGFTDIDGHNFHSLTIITLPTNGTLLHSGTPITQPYTLRADSITDLSYIPEPDAHGISYDSFAFHVQDDGGVEYGGMDTDLTSNTITINVSSVSDAPQGFDTTINTTEDTARAFTLVDFGFIDVDGDSHSAVIIDSLPSSGQLLLSGASVTAGQIINTNDVTSLTFVPDPGTNGYAITSLLFRVQDTGDTLNGGQNTDPTANKVIISIASVNDAPLGTNGTIATLEDMQYSFTVNDFGFSDYDGDTFLSVTINTLPLSGQLHLNGSAVTAGQEISVENIADLTYTSPPDASGTSFDNLTFTVRDDGGLLNGGQDTAQVRNTLQIDVTPVNDPPTGTDRNLTNKEDGARILTIADFGFSDLADGHSLAAITITSLPAHGTLSLNNSPLMAGQKVDAIDINSGALIFEPTPNTYGLPYSNLTYTVQDDGDITNGGADTSITDNTLTFYVTSVNDEPDGTDKTIELYEGSTHTLDIQDFGFSDPNDLAPNVNDASDTTTLQQIRFDTLPSIGTLVLNGAEVNVGQIISATDIAAQLLVYAPPPTAYGLTASTFTVVDNGGVTDGGIDTDLTANTLQFNIINVNNAPDGTDLTVSLLEDSSHTLKSTDFGFTDVLDGDALSGIEVISTPVNGTLALAGAPVLNGSTIDISDINSGSLTFTPDANQHGIGYATLEFNVMDNGGIEHGGENTSISSNVLTFDVNSVNDMPAAIDTTVSTPEDIPYTFSSLDFGFSDPNDTNQLLSVTLNTTPLKGTLMLNGNAVASGDVIPATDINTGNLTYIPANNAHGQDSLNFTVKDDGGTANGGLDQSQNSNTTSISIDSVNDAPTATNGTINILEDTGYILSVSDFGFADTIDGDQLSAIKIVNSPSHGQLTLSGTLVESNTTISSADINNNLLQFMPATNDNGQAYDTIEFQVQDNGGTTLGGTDTSTGKNILTFNIDAVNDAPYGTSSINSILESTQHTFTLSDFGFEDLENHNFSAITIKSFTSAGTLSLLDGNGTANQVSVNDTISTTAIDLGLLVFNPVAREHGADYASMDFIVHDDGGTALNGQDQDQSPNTWSLNVQPVNNEPSGTDASITLQEDATLTIKSSDFGFSDIADNDNFTGVLIKTIPYNGTLMLAGMPLLAGQSISISDINANLLTYTPLANATGIAYDSFEFQVSDDGGTLNGGINFDQSSNTLTFNVTAVNDPPTGNDKNVSTLEDSVYQFDAQDFIFTDIENNSLHSVRIDSLPAIGELLFGNSSVAIGMEVAASDLSQLIYKPQANYNGPAAFQFTVTDDGGDAAQAVASNTINISVMAVNDAPQSSNKTVQTNDNQSYFLSRSDFNFFDHENDSLAAIRIDSLPDTGLLTIAGQNVEVGTTIMAADLDTQKFVYTPDENSGVEQSAFGYSVIDSGGTSNGGDNTATQSSVLSFEIIQINDGPSIGADTLSVAEGESTELTDEGNSSLLANDSDADNDPLITQLIVAPNFGQFELNSDGTFRYQHDGSESTIDEVVYRVSDGSASVDAKLQINILPVNDAPVALPLTDQTLVTSTPFTINLPDNTFTDTDPGDELTITAYLASDDPTLTPTALPAWLSFEQSTLSFSGTPPEVTTLPIILQASDRSGLLAATQFVITVEPASNTALAEPQIETIAEAPAKVAVSNGPTSKGIVEELSNANLSESFSQPINDIAAVPVDTPQVGALEPRELEVSTPIFRDFERYTRAIENHRTFSVNSLTEASATLEVQENTTLADLFFSDERNSLTNTNMLSQMNSEREQLESDVTLNTKIIGGAVSVSTGLSIGYVIWLVRGGLLIGSVLSSLPAWRNIDPLPVLSSLDDGSDDSDDESLEEMVDGDNDNNHENMNNSRLKGKKIE